MAEADVLPYDYEEYAKEIVAYIDSAKKKAQAEFTGQTVNFADASQAAHHFEQAAAKILAGRKILRAMLPSSIALCATPSARSDPRRAAEPSMVSACDLCAGTVHRVRSGGHSWD